MTTTATQTFTSREVLDLLDITYRQLQLWVDRGWIPGMATRSTGGAGSGHTWRWTPEQVDAARVVRDHLDQARARPNRRGRWVVTAPLLPAAQRRGDRVGWRSEPCPAELVIGAMHEDLGDTHVKLLGRTFTCQRPLQPGDTQRGHLHRWAGVVDGRRVELNWADPEVTAGGGS